MNATGDAERHHMTAHSPEEELHLIDRSAGRTHTRLADSLDAAACVPWRHSARERAAIYIVLMNTRGR